MTQDDRDFGRIILSAAFRRGRLSIISQPGEAERWKCVVGGPGTGERSATGDSLVGAIRALAERCDGDERDELLAMAR